jgi:hypothetical protein
MSTLQNETLGYNLIVTFCGQTIEITIDLQY